MYFHKPGQPMSFLLSSLQFPQLLLSEEIQEQDNISPSSFPQGSFHRLQAENKDALKPGTQLSLPKDFPGSPRLPHSLPGHHVQPIQPQQPLLDSLSDAPHSLHCSLLLSNLHSTGAHKSLCSPNIFHCLSASIPFPHPSPDISPLELLFLFLSPAVSLVSAIWSNSSESSQPPFPPWHKVSRPPSPAFW